MGKRTIWNDHNIKTRVIDKYYMVIEELLVELQKLKTQLPMYLQLAATLV